MNLDVLTDILAEIAAVMRPKRSLIERKWNMSWNKVVEEKAGNRIALLTTRVMVELAQRLQANEVAEVLAIIAVSEGIGDDTGLWRKYTDRLTAE